MFAARYDDKRWHLCISHGQIIRGTSYPRNKWRDFIFKDQPSCKACADELNKDFWKIYNGNNFIDKKIGKETCDKMLEVIKKYATIKAIETV